MGAYIMPRLSQEHKIPKMGKVFWLKKIGGKLQNKVEKQLLKGKMMDNTSGHQYSKQYAKYKARRFKRFGSGTNLKGMEGASFISNDVSKVTMIATGRTVRSLTPTKPKDTSITMVFKDTSIFGVQNTDKIIYNRERGYDIVGLNDELRKWVFEEMLKQSKINIKKYLKPNEVVVIR